MAQLSDVVARIWRGLKLPQQDGAVMAGRLTPVYLVDDLTKPPATNPQITQPYMGGLIQGANAGNPSAAMIYNPPNSGFLLHVARIQVSVSTAGPVLGILGVPAVVGGVYDDNGTNSYIQNRDRRNLALPVPELHGTNDSGDTIQATAASWAYQATVAAMPIDLDLWLPPGQMFAIEQDTVNVAMRVTWWGTCVEHLGTT